MTDIEIAKNVKLETITEIAKKIDINEDDIESYGKYKAKISNDIYTKLAKKENGKLILVTAINPPITVISKNIPPPIIIPNRLFVSTLRPNPVFEMTSINVKANPVSNKLSVSLFGII